MWKWRSASVITGGKEGNSIACHAMEGVKLVSAESILFHQGEAHVQHLLADGHLDKQRWNMERSLRFFMGRRRGDIDHRLWTLL